MIDPESQPEQPLEKTPSPYWIGFIVAVLVTCIAARLAIPSLIFEDDFTYNALLNYYQHAPQYTFEFSEALDRMEIARFWLAFWPLMEAVLSHFSGLHGLLVTGIYIAPALVLISSLALYNLARSLGLGRAGAVLATTAHLFSLLRLTTNGEAGVFFFDRFPEDKSVAVFVLAPMFFRSLVTYLEKNTLRTFILFGLITLSIVWTHPVVLGMSAMIAGLFGLLNVLSTNKIFPLMAALGLISVFMLAPLSFVCLQLKIYMITRLKKHWKQDAKTSLSLAI
ncbi:MAG: hypothetical protein HC806_02600 [Anaerolineae bacterium]|nr:hypothetical protein [Anaerolineae bacterium]